MLYKFDKIIIYLIKKGLFNLVLLRKFVILLNLIDVKSIIKITKHKKH